MHEYTHYSRYPEKNWRWKSFSPKEIACRGDSKLIINEDAMDKLQALRDELKIPLIVNSAYRSPAYNKRIGGATKSQHLQAKAFDIAMTNHVPAVFEKAARKVGFTGFGFYQKNNFMHIDTGPKREWNKRWWKPGDTSLPKEPERIPETISKDKDLIGTTIGGGGLIAVLTQILPALSGLNETAQMTAIVGLSIAGLAIAFVFFRKLKRHV